MANSPSDRPTVGHLARTTRVTYAAGPDQSGAVPAVDPLLLEQGLRIPTRERVLELRPKHQAKVAEWYDFVRREVLAMRVSSQKELDQILEQAPHHRIMRKYVGEGRRIGYHGPAKTKEPIRDDTPSPWQRLKGWMQGLRRTKAAPAADEASVGAPPQSGTIAIDTTTRPEAPPSKAEPTTSALRDVEATPLLRGATNSNAVVVAPHPHRLDDDEPDEASPAVEPPNRDHPLYRVYGSRREMAEGFQRPSVETVHPPRSSDERKERARDLTKTLGRKVTLKKTSDERWVSRTPGTSAPHVETAQEIATLERRLERLKDEVTPLPPQLPQHMEQSELPRYLRQLGFTKRKDSGGHACYVYPGTSRHLALGHRRTLQVHQMRNTQPAYAELRAIAIENALRTNDEAKEIRARLAELRAGDRG